jgi:hypothetical protein
VRGRFTSVDPENAGAYAGNPQTWNGYSYGLNNPMLYSDPDGLKVRVCDTSGNCTDDKTDLTDEQWNKWFGGDKSVKLKGGNIYKNGELIGTYQQQSCDSCLYDIHALGRQVVANDPGNRAVKTWLVSVLAGLSTPSSLGYAALSVFALVTADDGSSEAAIAASIKADRQYAVNQAWKQEAEQVRRTGRGTRAWTADELRQLRDTGRVSGYEGHHINSVKGNEGNRALIRNPNNIEFVKKGKAEHLGRHGGLTRNPTTGPLIRRR